jgi:nitrile hydratase
MTMAAKFQPGDTVRIRVGAPPGHFRTPGYIQGKSGVIAALHGAFPNPESLAHGGDGLPKQFLYLVRFDQTHIWPQYPSTLKDKLLIDVYEHWLEPA